MTENCTKTVDKLQQESETFCDLSVEQLLYSAIIGTDLEEVKTVLETTDWSEWCSNVPKEN